jgi:UDP-N-acetylglucosamine 2-epimerase (non-hydrolysing)
MPAKLVIVAGARPNFMKIAPLIHELRCTPEFATILVHTGQHYDENMSGRFFQDLDLPLPDYHLEVGSGSHAQQTAEIMKRFEPVVLAEKPQGVVVAGDVNSTMACAIVAKKLDAPVIHVEAGLRSFDRTMPEEINRVVTDAISDLLLVTEESGRRNLRAEGVPSDRIAFVGNLMIDSLKRNLERARQSDVQQRLGIEPGRFGLVTLHRPSNVDAPHQLRNLLEALEQIAEDLPLYWPVHPRTAVRLQETGLRITGRVFLIEPLGYLDFLSLMSKSAVVLTDSGGIQEETTVLGVPCLTLRENTERPVTIEQGTNRLAGTSKASILRSWHDLQREPKRGVVPDRWDGNAAQRCRQALLRFFSMASSQISSC